jgi:phosphate uptake regulator
MKRKLIKQGLGGLTFYVPKKWTEINHLKAGDEIEVQEEDSKLIIFGRGAPDKYKTSITLEKASKHFIHELIGNLYKKGYDEIKVGFDKPDTLKIIEEVVNELLGFEIVDIKNKKITIKNVSTTLEDEYLNLFKKCFLLCKQNFQRTITDIEKKSYLNLSEIERYRFMLLRYVNYCQRVLLKHKRSESFMVFEYLVINSLEKISNEIYYLYSYLDHYNPQIDQSSLDHLKKTFYLFEELFSNYFKENIKAIRVFSKEKEKFFLKEFDKLIENKKTDHHVIHRISNIMRRCQDAVGPFYGRYR